MPHPRRTGGPAGSGLPVVLVVAPAVIPLQSVELLVGPGLQHLPLVHHDDEVAVLDGRQPVGHGQDRHLVLRDDVVQRRLHLPLAHVVQRARRLVQQQHLRLADDAARDGQALLLPPAELRPPRPDVGVVPVGQPEDGVVDVGALGRLVHLRLRGIRLAVPDVGAHRVVEQDGLLLHEPAVLAPPPQVQLRERLALGAHLATEGVVEAHQQRDDGALAAARRPQQRHPLPPGEVQVEALQDLHVRARRVAEGHVLERAAARNLLEGHAGVPLAVDRGGAVNHGQHALRGHRGLRRVPGHREHLPHAHRAHQDAHGAAEHRPAVDLAGMHQRPAVPEGQRERGEDDELREPVAEPRHEGLGDVDGAVQEPDVALDLQLLQVEREHRAARPDAFGSDLPSLFRVRPLRSHPIHVLVADVAGNDEGRKDAEGDERELPRGDERDDQTGPKADTHVDVRPDCAAPHPLDLRGIRGQPRAEGPRLMARHVKEPDVLVHEAAEEACAQPRRQLLSGSGQASNFGQQRDQVEEAEAHKQEAPRLNVLGDGAWGPERGDHLREQHRVDGVGRASGRGPEDPQQQPGPLGRVHLRNPAYARFRFLGPGLNLRILLNLDGGGQLCRGHVLAHERSGLNSGDVLYTRIHRLHAHGLFVGLLLRLAHGGIGPILPRQLLVRAGLQQPGVELRTARLGGRIPRLNEADAVTVLDRHQPMRDGQHRAALHHVVQCLLHDHLALAVQGACGLVQQQDLGVFDDGAGDGDPLLLATAQLPPGLAHLCVVAVWKVADDVMDECLFAGLNDLVLRRCRVGPLDILQNRRGK
mmetsp:Transcript_100078/g.169003  ORF Transcript_100078/g.169003 Transcript_100078/m.169003 type:complete len:813 (+) Transcript_100078:1867-4305(+)